MIDTHTILFEISWEVCNRVGGIYTVISSKLNVAHNFWKDNYYLIGPLVDNNVDFVETKELEWIHIDEILIKYNIKCKYGRWGSNKGPKVILIDYKQNSNKIETLSNLLLKYKLDLSLYTWPGIESGVFGMYSGILIALLEKYHLGKTHKIIAHFHEWMCVPGILTLKLKGISPHIIFTIHCTSIGRYLASTNQLDYLETISYITPLIPPNIQFKHLLEKLGCLESNCFTTVSELTNHESKKLFDKEADFIIPNGLDQIKSKTKKTTGTETINKMKLYNQIQNIIGTEIDFNTKLIVYAGRSEFRNKGLDVLLSSLKKVENFGIKIIFIGIIILKSNELKYILPPDNHVYSNHKTDDFTKEYLSLTKNFIKEKCIEIGLNNGGNLKCIFIPNTINSPHNILKISYKSLVKLADLTVFPSLYEPWGYTPFESAFWGTATITTDKSGFGKWIINKNKSSSIVKVIPRNPDSDDTFIRTLSTMILEILVSSKMENEKDNFVFELTWDHLYKDYIKAYSL